MTNFHLEKNNNKGETENEKKGISSWRFEERAYRKGN